MYTIKSFVFVDFAHIFSTLQTNMSNIQYALKLLLLKPIEKICVCCIILIY